MEKIFPQIDCKICKNICTDYKKLYENGARNEAVYNILVKYYQPMFLSQNKNIKLLAICLSCWKLITDFDDFQNEMISTQSKMEGFAQNEFGTYAETNQKNHGDICSYFANPNNDSKDDENIEPTDIFTAAVSLEPMADETSNILPPPIRIKKLRLNTWRIKNQNQFQQHHREAKKVFNISEVYKAPQPKRTLKMITTKLSTHLKNVKTSSDGFSNLNDEKPDEQHNHLEADISVDNSAIEDSESEKSIETNQNKIDFIEKWKPQLDCPLCKQLLSGWKALAEHFKKQHSKQATYYVCCKRKLGLTHLVYHVRWHMDPNCYKCNTWGKSFSSPAQLKRHKVNHLSRELILKGEVIKENNVANIRLISQCRQQLDCPVCHEPAKDWPGLNRHFQSQHAEKRCYYECCYRKFYLPSTLANHLRLHSNPEMYKCKICEQSFSRAITLIRHTMTANTGTVKRKCNNRENNIIAKWKSNLECAICKETSANFSILRSHFRCKHSNETPYIICCERRLESRSLVADHARLHLNIDAFKCKICKKYFTCRTELQQHLNYTHSISAAGNIVERKLKCRHCGQAFHNKLDWKEHEAHHMGVYLYKCAICAQEFRSVYLLKIHWSKKHAENTHGLWKTMEISQKAAHDNVPMNQVDSNAHQDLSTSNAVVSIRGPCESFVGPRPH